jgi:ribosomal protein L14
MSLQRIQSAILAANLDNEQLSLLTQFCINQKTENSKRSISVGDSVWVVQKTKRTPGVVQKVNIKKAIVRMNGGQRYNVPLSMLAAQ